MFSKTICFVTTSNTLVLLLYCNKVVLLFQSFLVIVVWLKWPIFEMTYLWNDLSMKWPIYEMTYLWNDLSMKWPSIRCVSIKCPNTKYIQSGTDLSKNGNEKLVVEDWRTLESISDTIITPSSCILLIVYKVQRNLTLVQTLIFIILYLCNPRDWSNLGIKHFPEI